MSIHVQVGDEVVEVKDPRGAETIDQAGAAETELPGGPPAPHLPGRWRRGAACITVRVGDEDVTVSCPDDGPLDVRVLEQEVAQSRARQSPLACAVCADVTVATELLPGQDAAACPACGRRLFSDRVEPPAASPDGTVRVSMGHLVGDQWVRRYAVQVARVAAHRRRDEHGYLPQSLEESKAWVPHAWVVDAVASVARTMEEAQRLLLARDGEIARLRAALQRVSAAHAVSVSDAAVRADEALRAVGVVPASATAIPPPTPHHTQPGVDYPTDADVEAEPLLQLFRWHHLRPGLLRETSRQFCVLAIQMVRSLPDNPERVEMLRKLREAKDCAVTSLVWK